MFSSLIQNVPSGVKFGQAGSSSSKPPKQPFTVRVFNAFPPYTQGPKSDTNYRAPSQSSTVAPIVPRDPSSSKWYPASYAPNSSYPSYDKRTQTRTPGTYAIYPSGRTDTFIYEQSSCSKSDLFSNSELDTASTTTLTPSTPFADRLLEDPRTSRPTTTASSYSSQQQPAVSQVQAIPIGRTASKNPQAKSVSELGEDLRSRVVSLPSRSNTPFRSASVNMAPIQVPNAPGPGPMLRLPSIGSFEVPVEVPEYEVSTFSEMEVEARDRIAKINANLNAQLTGGFYANAVAAGRATSDPVQRLSTAPAPQTIPHSTKDQVNRISSSQPLHPSLHFPNRMMDTNPGPVNSSTHAILHDSPPRVERLPSQLPSPYSSAHASTSSVPNPSAISEIWSRDALHKRPLNDVSVSDNLQSPHSAYGSYAASSQDGIGAQNRTSPADMVRQHRRSSVAGPRPDVVGGLRPSSEIRDDTPPRAGSDASHSTHSTLHSSRDRRDVPRESPGRTSPHDNSSRNTNPELETGRDVRSSIYRDSEREQSRPAPPSRRNSFAPEPQRPPKDGRAQYSSGPLSSSPVQMRPFEDVIPVPPSRQSVVTPAVADNERPYNRMRARSNSFSTPGRPVLQSQPQPLPSQIMQAQPTYDRMPRYEDDVLRLPRRDSQGAHYNPSSMNAYRSGPLPGASAPPVILQTAGSSVMERTVSSRPGTMDSIPSSHPQRPMYADQYVTTPTGYPRSAGPYDIPGPQNKYVEISGSFKATHMPSTHPNAEPQRRYSDGDQNVTVKPPLVPRNSAPALRSVRWNENLICPSPIPGIPRRKGWFNRRGDQLWTNDGAFRSPPAGQEYPSDLDDYPEPADGWMNEEGVRIDLNHRLIPKPPLRSALKQPRP